jgi:hypothetical protein
VAEGVKQGRLTFPKAGGSNPRLPGRLASWWWRDPTGWGRLQPYMKKPKCGTPAPGATANCIQAGGCVVEALLLIPGLPSELRLVCEIKTELIELHTPFSCFLKSVEAQIFCVPQRLVVEGATFRQAPCRTRDKWLAELLPPSLCYLGAGRQEGPQCSFLSCNVTTRQNPQLGIRTCCRKVIRTSATIRCGRI